MEKAAARRDNLLALPGVQVNRVLVCVCLCTEVSPVSLLQGLGLFTSQLRRSGWLDQEVLLLTYEK